MFIDEIIELFIASRKPKAGITVSKRTVELYRMCLEDFSTFMSDRNKTDWDSIIAKDVRAYVEYVHGNKRWPSVATKFTYLRAARTLCKFVSEDRECQEEHLKNWMSVIGSVPQNPSRKFIPAVKDLRTMKSAWNTKRTDGLRNYIVYCLILGCGFRIGEICWLRMEHLQLEQSTIFVPPEGKTGSRLVPVDSKMVGLLKLWLKRRAKLPGADQVPWVFLGREASQCTRNMFGLAFRTIQKGSTKLQRVTPHVLRHSFGTYYLRNGGNMERLRLIMGHSTYKTLQGYLHLAEVGSDQAKAELEKVSPLKMVSSR